uniref:Beta-1,4-galactosyltransferase n=1 Tax=Buteo japonicus TaxID=224669 RepID=A0A8C0BDE9_9AVES
MVLLQAAAVLFRFLQQIPSSGLEQLEANTAERPAWMFREGIRKRAVVSKAMLSAGPTYSCMGGTDCFRDRTAEQRSPGKQRALMQTHEPKSCKVGLIGSIGARGCHCLLSLRSASSNGVFGALHVEFSQPVNLEEVARINPEVKAGGRFAPKDCIALQKVAIIIPFRNREEHLKYWLYYLHPILQRQQLDYGVYVINQDGEEEFNRAKLLNIGFAEALKEYDYDCFVFSDVDLIPMDDRNTYKCYSQPRHLSVSMDKFGFRLPYNQYFGGVSALSKEQFTKINGFPNNYWGWGGEDDDIYNRLVFKGMGISRPDAVIGKCRMIRHSRDRKNEPNPERFDRIAHTRETMSSDGLNTLSYKVLRTDKYPLYTKITVDIGSPNS